MTELTQRAREIRLLILDVDGVLTDGSLYFGPEGEACKRFNVHDGAGIKAVQHAGVQVAWVSARDSIAVQSRAADLQVTHLVQGERDKGAALNRLAQHLRLAPAAVAAVGDDIADLPMLEAAGLAVAVANARPEVKAAADLVTQAAGGHGAVREVCDLLLAAAEAQC